MQFKFVFSFLAILTILTLLFWNFTEASSPRPAITPEIAFAKVEENTLIVETKVSGANKGGCSLIIKQADDSFFLPNDIEQKPNGDFTCGQYEIPLQNINFDESPKMLLQIEARGIRHNSQTLDLSKHEATQ